MSEDLKIGEIPEEVKECEEGCDCEEHEVKEETTN